jgi:hypothetical protein
MQARRHDSHELPASLAELLGSRPRRGAGDELAWRYGAVSGAAGTAAPAADPQQGQLWAAGELVGRWAGWMTHWMLAAPRRRCSALTQAGGAMTVALHDRGHPATCPLPRSIGDGQALYAGLQLPYDGGPLQGWGSYGAPRRPGLRARPGSAAAQHPASAPPPPAQAGRQPVALDFGPSYRPGYLPHPAGDEAAGKVANLPAATGTAIKLLPARLPPDSCVPPPFLEPFAPSSAVQKYQVGPCRCGCRLLYSARAAR